MGDGRVVDNVEAYYLSGVSMLLFAIDFLLFIKKNVDDPHCKLASCFFRNMFQSMVY